jgi:hypothetical protein
MSYELRVMSSERGAISHKRLAISYDEVKHGF